MQQLIIEDAPCLERLHHHSAISHHKKMDICVMSAPKLGILGHIYDHYPRLEIGPTVFQGLHVVTMATVLRGVKVLSLSNKSLSLNAVLNVMKCFPCLEMLNIQTLFKGRKNVWGNNHNLINTCLKKIVLRNYSGNESHVNFVKFFVLNARVIESIRLVLRFRNASNGWIKGQHRLSHGWIEEQCRLLEFEERASKSAQLEFVSSDRLCDEAIA